MNYKTFFVYVLFLIPSGVFAMMPEDQNQNIILELNKNLTVEKSNNTKLRNTIGFLLNSYDTNLKKYMMLRCKLYGSGALLAGAMVGLFCNNYLKRSRLFSSIAGIVTAGTLGFASYNYLSNWYNKERIIKSDTFSFS